MLTKRDQELAKADLVSFDRLRALQHALLEDSRSARERSKDPSLSSQAAAALRGQAGAMQKASDRVGVLLVGGALKRPWWARFRRGDDGLTKRERALLGREHFNDMTAPLSDEEKEALAARDAVVEELGIRPGYNLFGEDERPSTGPDLVREAIRKDRGGEAPPIPQGWA